MPREKIGYDPNDALSILGRTFRCPKLKQYKTFLSCPDCEHFPCEFLDGQDMEMLVSSPFLNKTVTGLKITRRQDMEYIGKTKEGELEFLNQDFDPANPDLDLITRYDEIYPVSKVYVPQVKLVTKTKPERERVKQKMEQEQVDSQDAEQDEAADNSKSSSSPKQSKAKQKGLLEEVPEPEPEQKTGSSAKSQGKKAAGKAKDEQEGAEG